jgi:hypothetical protein
MRPNQREHQAAAEAGQTTFSRGVAPALVLAFLIVVSAVPIIDLARNPSTMAALWRILPRDFPQKSVEPAESRSDLARWNSQLQQNMTAAEKALEQESLLRASLLPPLNRLLTGMLGATNGDVCRGREDWLFYAPAVRHLTAPPFLQTAPDGLEPVTAMVRFRDQLAARGVTLVVVPIPVKASIYPELLAGPYDGDVPVHNASYDPMRERLRDQGILVCDLAPAFMAAKSSGQAYLARDSHWTPHGMAAAAEEIAAFIRGQVPELPPGTLDLRPGVPQPVTNAGDLEQMLGHGAKFATRETVAFAPVLHADGRSWAPDPDAPVLLLGDSFANIYAREDMGWGTGSGLAAELSRALQLPVDAITQNGNGAFATRAALNEALRRGDDRLQHKTVLVFTFSARELSLGDWKAAMELATVGTQTDQPSGHTPVEVSGTIQETATPPAPGSVPYRDCIIATRLVGVQGPAGIPDTVEVYRWGMRDNRWTEAARQRIGDSIRITMQPWDAVVKEFESYNRMELESAQYDTTSWWQVDAPVLTAEESVTPDQATGRGTDPDADLSELIQAMEADNLMVHAGREGWYFFLPELRFLNAGTFWGADSARTSRAANAQFADPLPAIVDFHQQLEKAGILLLMVPVPAKASIYHDRTALPGMPADPAALRAFYEELRRAGLHIVDLHDPFSEAASRRDPAVYCRQDTHWSPAGIRLAAEEIASELRAQPTYMAPDRAEFVVEERAITITGDLWSMLPEPRPAPETLPLWHVIDRATNAPISPDRDSPVLLMGDSHCLVFHAGGDLHAEGAGLPDLLALELGFPLDVVAVRGSGATAPRTNLARRRDNLAGKQAVIWCFTVREFTESTSGWRPVPVIQ